MTVGTVERSVGLGRVATPATVAPRSLPTASSPSGLSQDHTALSAVPARGRVPVRLSLMGASVSSGLVAPADATVLREGVQGVGGTQSTQHEPLTDGVVPATLRLGLVVAQSQAIIGVSVRTSLGGVTLEPGKRYQIQLTSGGQLSIEALDGRRHRTAVTVPTTIDPGPDGTVNVGGHRYRGSLTVIAAPGVPGKLTVVNTVGLDDYLKGVLPAEMATGWPLQALEAQAVAARTYAAANMGRRGDLGFDLYPTVSDQVYKGLDVEAADTTSAVDATQGQVMTYQGTPINALFFSSSGGSTDDAKAVWDIDLPYIKAVADPDASPNEHWQALLSRDQVQSGLNKIGVNVGAPTSISVSGTTPGGRVRWLAVNGDHGSATVDANKLRLAIGLKSTKFAIAPTRDGWRLDGSGYGHGLGLSQWGARAKALAGQSYQDILHTYYTGIEISP